jgi:signal transduction histidine kinase/ActR/RegA family two-component response regulator
MSSETDFGSLRVLVLAPTGRDAALTTRVLAEAEIEAFVCRSAAELGVEIERGAGAALVAEEALDSEDVTVLVSALVAQPFWSALPLLVMVSDEAGVERVMTTLAPRANVTVLQRPTRIAMLLSAVRAALRWRERQYETRDLLERLREADRQKDEFLATVSHELRTPLNAIVGWTTIMEAEPCTAPTHQRGLEVLGRSARAQATIIDDLLDVSRIITGKVRLVLREVDLAEAVLTAVESVRPAAAARGLTVDTPLPSHRVCVRGDFDRIQQIAWNLVSNSVKFTPEGGRVTVEIGKADSRAFLKVSDTGRGIAPEFVPFVFDRFRQADSSTTRRHGGLGLGLSIVRHLAELHGGTVRAESAGIDQGAAFTVSFPGVDGPETDGEPEASADGQLAEPLAQVPSLDGVRVLVVDDSPDAIEMMRVLLGGYGADVRVASSAVEGLAQVIAWRPDVLVSDIAMPERDGFWLVEHVRMLAPEEGGDTPAVALTALADRDDRARALTAGFQRHLRKPVSLGEIGSAVAELAGRN